MNTTATILSQQTARQMLHDLGWLVDTEARFARALKNFQRGWSLGPALAVDGVLGPKTSAALEESDQRRRAGRRTASEHFSFREFACKCDHTAPSCEGIRVLRPLIGSLERLRAQFYPGGLTIVSGYRCPDHNKAIGGAKTSQHLFGAAADVPKKVSAAKVATLDAFAGIGKHPKSGLVDHVDRRDASGTNPTGSSVTSPKVFFDPPK